MLRNLLLRDLAMHRWVAVSAFLAPLLITGVTLALWPNQPDPEAPVAVPMGIGLLLLTILPLTLHIREGRLGTLGDLLALPIRRSDLVALRFLEALLACAVFLAVHLAAWSIARPGTLRGPLDFLGSPGPLWILLTLLAYPLPFTLRWGGKGLAIALGALFGTLTLIGQIAMLCGPRSLLAWVLKPLLWIGEVHASLGPLGRKAMGFGIPLLLIAIFYAISLRVARRLEA